MDIFHLSPLHLYTRRMALSTLVLQRQTTCLLVYSFTRQLKKSSLPMVLLPYLISFNLSAYSFW